MNVRNCKGASCVGIILLLATGCQQKPASEPPSVTRTPFEQSLRLGDVYALANGGAYLSSHRGIYYVNRGVAEKVSGLPAATFGDVVALADGTALYRSSFEGRPKMFWLHGAEASPVEEGGASGEVQFAPSREGYLFAENQRLKRRLEELESEVAAMQDYEEPYYEDERY